MIWSNSGRDWKTERVEDCRFNTCNTVANCDRIDGQYSYDLTVHLKNSNERKRGQNIEP